MAKDTRQKILDTAKAVAQRISATMGRRRREIGTNGASGVGIRHQIPPAAAKERVRPAAADQDVIAEPAIKEIRPTAPHQLVLARPAEKR